MSSGTSGAPPLPAATLTTHSPLPKGAIGNCWVQKGVVQREFSIQNPRWNHVQEWNELRIYQLSRRHRGILFRAMWRLISGRDRSGSPLAQGSRQTTGAYRRVIPSVARLTSNTWRASSNRSR